MLKWILTNNNKRQKISNSIKFNSYSAQNFINKELTLNSDICNTINIFLFDKQIAKKEWQNKINLSLSLINKRYCWVPIYYFPNNFKLYDRTIGNYIIMTPIMPCTECYIHAMLTNEIKPLECLTCELFQIQHGILIGEKIININHFKYYESIIKMVPKIARILINSDKFMAENVLTISCGIITTKLTKNSILYDIQFNKPQLKKIM